MAVILCFLSCFYPNVVVVVVFPLVMLISPRIAIGALKKGYIYFKVTLLEYIMYW